MQAEISSERAKLRKRIRRFYEHFRNRDWAGCYGFVDPALRDQTVKFDRYAKSLASFFDHFGPIVVMKVEELDVHTDVRSRGYEDRDFAHGLLLWRDRRNERHLLRERWVKRNGNWYTRMTGLVTPDEAVVRQSA